MTRESVSPDDGAPPASSVPVDVRIRPWSDQNLDLLRQSNSPGMTAYLGGPETDDAVVARHSRYLSMWHAGEARMFAIVDGATEEEFGACGWWHTTWHGDDVCEAGWSVIPGAQGRGVATAAVRLLVADARLHGERHLLTAFPSVKNDASNRLCAAAGFSQRGVEEFPFRGTMLTVNAWVIDIFDAN